MKELVEFFQKKGLLFQELKSIEPKTFGIKKRVELFFGVDAKRRYVVILKVKRKSRILQKDVEEFEDIVRRLEERMDIRIKQRFLLFDAPLCSKAKEKLLESGWNLYDIG